MVENIFLPLAVYRYRVTLVDGLAYERLPGEWLGKTKVAFILPLVAVGVISGLISDWPAFWWWSAVGALALIWAVAGVAIYNLRMHRRAQAMAAREGQTELEEWGDHLAIRSQSGERFLPYELIGKAVTTDSHIFILYRGGPTIVPLRAFEDAEAMRSFGEVLERRSKESAL